MSRDKTTFKCKGKKWLTTDFEGYRLHDQLIYLRKLPTGLAWRPSYLILHGVTYPLMTPYRFTPLDRIGYGGRDSQGEEYPLGRHQTPNTLSRENS